MDVVAVRECCWKELVTYGASCVVIPCCKESTKEMSHTLKHTEVSKGLVTTYVVHTSWGVGSQGGKEKKNSQDVGYDQLSGTPDT